MIMPCLGARKKSNSRQQSTSLTLKGSFMTPNHVEPSSPGISGQSKPPSVASVQPSVLAQMKQEYNELKSKNQEHLDIIAKQKAELEQLKQQLKRSTPSISERESKNDDSARAALLDLEARNKETLSTLAEKEMQLEESNKRIQELLDKLDHHQDNDSALHFTEKEEGQEQEIKKTDNDHQQQQQQQMEADKEKEDMYQQLEEKDRMLHDMQMKLEELQIQWEAERAELVKPALEQVNAQLEELKETNKIAVERLTEKENELAELRSQLNRRDRKPKQSLNKDQENQRRLNRLTMDLENDRLLIQRLDELNQQLETQKQKHESILESHAKTIAEKDQALLQHQKSLKQLKIAHENATKQLEQEQLHNLKKLQLQHQNEMATLNKRLKQAESQAKSNINDELDQILVEFEQSQHNHSVQVAHLQQSYQEQISAMRHGQQAEIRSLIGSEQNNNNMFKQPASINGSVSKLRSQSKFTWPPVAV